MLKLLAGALGALAALGAAFFFFVAPVMVDSGANRVVALAAAPAGPGRHRPS